MTDTWASGKQLRPGSESSRPAARDGSMDLESGSDRVASLVCSEEWRILEGDPSSEQLLGTSREDMIGEVYWGVFPETLGTVVEEAYRRAMNGEAREIEALWKPSSRWLRHRCVPREGGGVSIRLTDVSSERRVENRLAIYERFLSTSRDMMALVDTDYVYRVANNAYFRAFNKKPSEIIGHKVEAVLGQEAFHTTIKQKLDECLSGREVQFHNWLEYPATGHRYVDVTYAPYYGSSCEVVGAFVHIHDITEIQTLYTQLVRAQRMQSVGHLAGGAAHDYNNALSVIIGFAELALKRVAPEDGIREYLNEILKAANRSARMTGQLLAFARQQTATPQILDINAAVHGMLTMLRGLIGEDIDLSWVPGVDVWQVRIDPSQVDQILANLAANARDAIDGVGKLTIETRNVTFDDAYVASDLEVLPGEYVMIAVSDNGCGMPPDVLQKVFEPFFTTKAVGKGTGLGLSTVYGIVKQNDGFVNVYSEPREGTTLRIYLPRYRGVRFQPLEEEPKEIPYGHSEVVLLVEDDDSLLSLGEKMLSSVGYVVLAANSPRAALRRAECHEGRIDLLITDVVMPEMNGRELSERIQELRPDIGTLFMSGYTADAISTRGVLDEDIRFLQKPFSLSELASRAREALDDSAVV